MWVIARTRQLVLEIINNDPFFIDGYVFLLVAFLYLKRRVPPLPAAIRRHFWPFKEFINIREAEALAQGVNSSIPVDIEPSIDRAARRRDHILAGFGTCQTLVWASICLYTMYKMPLIDPRQEDSELVSNAFISSLAWGYTCRPANYPRRTPAYDFLILYLVLLLRALEIIAVPAYQSYVWQSNYFTEKWGLYATAMNICVLAYLISVVLKTPVAQPGEHSGISPSAIGTTISPEDYTTLWNWITFSWMTPLTRKESLYKEEDVWNLTPTMASLALYTKYKDVGKRYKTSDGKLTSWSFFKHWWACNSLDMILLFSVSIISILLDFTSPLFIKLILDNITLLRNETNPVKARQLRALAMMYAFATFICTFARALINLQGLFRGRRAGTRSRNEIMIAIYEKALKRRDVITPPSTSNNSDPLKDAPNSREKQEAAADLGKVVNLMSSDATTLEETINMPYIFCDAPLKIIFAFIFLYHLLGWSAFAGLTVFGIVSPLNHIVSSRASKVFQNRQKASDRKMTLLNEMIAEIKFIKFMASEDRWIKRALAARAEELKYIRQSRYIDLIFSLFWNGTPIAVTVVSLGTFIWNGNRLSVSTAFTAILLFSMMSQSLSTFPMVLVRVLKVKISIKRISDFLSEQEVDPVATSLKPEDASLPQIRRDESTFVREHLGIENGFFEWSAPDRGTKDLTSEGSPQKKSRWKLGSWSKPVASESPPLPTLPNAAPDSTDTPTHSSEALEQLTEDFTAENGTSATPSRPIVAERQFQLRGINVIFPPGELSLIVGPTACGKTALLRVLLGEMYTLPLQPESSGTTNIFLPRDPTRLIESTGMRSYVSYASQTPWLEHLSIKENILFGSEFDEIRYKQVLECCALNPDLRVLEDGDETEIGERGVTLSGGQKARVALARAVYAPTGFVLLDDPLSAVDSHTARFLVERLFRGPLLAHRTVVLVTHHVDLVLPLAGYLVKMQDGSIETQGTVSDLTARSILDNIKSQLPEGTTERTESAAAEALETMEYLPKNMKSRKKLIEEEERARGSVKWSIYHKYITASAYSIWVAYLFFTMLRAGIQIGEKLWIQIWGEAYDSAPAFTPANTLHARQAQWQLSPVTTWVPGFRAKSPMFPPADEQPFFYVGVFASIGFALLISELLGSGVLILGSYRASRILFGRTLDSVTRATMRFHDTTPTGRILNRFSKDYNVIDTTMGFSFAYSLSCLSTILLSVITIVVVSPGFILPGTIIGLAYLHISRIYTRTTRPLKRLDSTTISPIFSSFRTTLEGLATIRAFSAERRFIAQLMNTLDASTKCTWAYWMMNRWCMVVFDIIGAVTILVVMVLLITFAQTGVFHGNSQELLNRGWNPSSGFEGLVIVTVMSFTSSVYWACRFLTQLELDLNSVERISEYEMIPQESHAVVESNKSPAWWPSTASQADFISVENLVIKYAPDLPAVLHGVSFKVRSGERVGLVGRTGSGKSTLATAFLRFVEPHKGRIIIDGLDISTIGLQDLRSRVTFIPQDCVLFSGTIRENLDPDNEYTDAACLDVLHRVHLVDKSTTSTRPPSVLDTSISDPTKLPSPSNPPSAENSVTKQAIVKLDSVVAPAGGNFSHGQRQLIALARALLRKTSVIVMDEATSSIDFETDTKIQEALREEFQSSCVITVAHRLQTILHYDRVIVMDTGRIVENGTPTDLMADVEGVFHSMCSKAGITATL